MQKVVRFTFVAVRIFVNAAVTVGAAIEGRVITVANTAIATIVAASQFVICCNVSKTAGQQHVAGFFGQINSFIHFLRKFESRKTMLPKSGRIDKNRRVYLVESLLPFVCWIYCAHGLISCTLDPRAIRQVASYPHNVATAGHTQIDFCTCTSLV